MPIMKSNNPIKPIFRVEWRNNQSGEVEAASIFFKYIEDAREYADGFDHVNCSAYIHKYWLK